MHTKESIQRGLEQPRHLHGGFAFDIPLPFGIWTKVSSTCRTRGSSAFFRSFRLLQASHSHSDAYSI